MAFKYRTAIYHYIFTRTCTTAAIFILTAFQTDSVIPTSKVEFTISAFYKIPNPVRHRSAHSSDYAPAHLQPAHSHTSADAGSMPESSGKSPLATTHSYTLSYSPSPDEGNDGHFATLLPFSDFGDIHIADSIPFQSFRIREPVGRTFIYTATGCCLLPDALRNLLTLQRTPVMTVSVNCPFAGYSYIFQVTAGNRRLATTGIQPSNTVSTKG